jgi:hypothetical protein
MTGRWECLYDRAKWRKEATMSDIMPGGIGVRVPKATIAFSYPSKDFPLVWPDFEAKFEWTGYLHSATLHVLLDGTDVTSKFVVDNASRTAVASSLSADVGMHTLIAKAEVAILISTSKYINETINATINFEVQDFKIISANPSSFDLWGTGTQYHDISITIARPGLFGGSGDLGSFSGDVHFPEAAAKNLPANVHYKDELVIGGSSTNGILTIVTDPSFYAGDFEIVGRAHLPRARGRFGYEYAVRSQQVPFQIFIIN